MAFGRRSLGYFVLTLGNLAVFSLETVRYGGQDVFCSQGLSDCSVRSEPSLSIAGGQAADVAGVTAKVSLCCRDEAQCSLCLLIDVQLHLHPIQGTQDRHEDVPNTQRGSLTFCYGTAAILPLCRKVQFTVTPAALEQQNMSQVSVVVFKPVGVSYGSVVFLHLSEKWQHQISVPSLAEVCSLQVHGRVEECDVPTISTVLNREASQVELQVSSRSNNTRSFVCLQYEKKGKCQLLHERTIPFYELTTCTCLQVWWSDGEHRSRSCPFVNQSDIFQWNIWRNLSVSLAKGQLSDAGAMMWWNLSAPCWIEAEVWPCVATGDNSCKRLRGFRQQVTKSDWRQNSRGLWETVQVFENIDLQLQPCLMVKITEMHKVLGPFCFDDTGGRRWRILVALPIVLLACLTAVVFLLLKDKSKRWMRLCHHSGFVQGRKGHVVLLSPPDTDATVWKSICELGLLLLNKGFSVSVDQWSRREQCSMGPLLWLHAQLLRVDNQGGRVVLVLTSRTLERTEEWAKEARSVPQGWSPYSDVFAASLYLIQAEKKLNRAEERFLLVRFSSRPAVPHSREVTLPEALRGLPLLCLPSQTAVLMSVLTEGLRQPGFWRYFWRWRVDQHEVPTSEGSEDITGRETKPLNQSFLSMT